MSCEQIRDMLVDLMEGATDAAAERAVRGHLDGCGACREEFEMLQRGHMALARSLEALAPDGGHLTQERFERLLESGTAARSPGKIITFRRFLGAAAAAAILACIPYLLSDVRSILRDSGESPPAAVAAGTSPLMPAPGPERVVLTAAPPSTDSREAVGYFVPGFREDAMPPEGRQAMRVIRSSEPDFEAPVQNVLYDAEEAGYWW